MIFFLSNLKKMLLKNKDGTFGILPLFLFSRLKALMSSVRLKDEIVFVFSCVFLCVVSSARAF